MKLAEITIELDCDGSITTYLKCKDDRDLLNKLKKRHKKGVFDFGHFRVYDEHVIEAGYKWHTIQ